MPTSPPHSQHNSSKSDHFGTVCAVMVTYNVGNDFRLVFNSLKGQLDHVIMVNTSMDAGQTAKLLGELQAEDAAFLTVMESPENNLGLAQNIGMEAALARGVDWVLLLDHDSRPAAGMLAAMQKAYQEAHDKAGIGLLAANLVDEEVNQPQRYLRSVGKWFEQVTFDAKTPVIDNVLCVAASGSLIPRRVLEQGLRMDEGFVIDYIDTEFCLRLLQQHLRILAVRDAVLHHRFGLRKSHRFLGRNIAVTHHPPLRRYYLYRNRLHTWKRYALSTPSFFCFDVMRVGYEIWRIALFEEKRLQKLTAIWEGVMDGLLGRTGSRRNSPIQRQHA